MKMIDVRETGAHLDDDLLDAVDGEPCDARLSGQVEVGAARPQVDSLGLGPLVHYERIGLLDHVLVQIVHVVVEGALLELAAEYAVLLEHEERALIPVVYGLVRRDRIEAAAADRIAARVHLVAHLRCVWRAVAGVVLLSLLLRCVVATAPTARMEQHARMSSGRGGGRHRCRRAAISGDTSSSSSGGSGRGCRRCGVHAEKERRVRLRRANGLEDARPGAGRRAAASAAAVCRVLLAAARAAAAIVADGRGELLARLQPTRIGRRRALGARGRLGICLVRVLVAACCCCCGERVR